MLLILSRKGFDSQAGGMPSPILPDGRMASLPIPDRQSSIRYRDLTLGNYRLGDVVQQLSNGRLRQSLGAHLDPDLSRRSLERHDGWRPIFGQVKAAQGHLSGHGVTRDDIFLFYGLFRDAVPDAHGLRFAPGSRPKHVIWGWMQIGDVVQVDACDRQKFSWAVYHPHFSRPPDRTNTLYVAAKGLTLPSSGANGIEGAGIFSYYHPELQLTAPDSTKVSVWHLPGWFYPESGKDPLTYHGNPERWKKKRDYVLLKTVARGQEFILNCSQYPEALSWIRHVIESAR